MPMKKSRRRRLPVFELELLPDADDAGGEPTIKEGLSDVVLSHGIHIDHEGGQVIISLYDEDHDKIFYMALDPETAMRVEARIGRRITQALGDHSSHELH